MTDLDIPALLDYRPEPGAFNDRVVLVTGAAAGIGRAIAQACAAAGAVVVLLDKDIKGLEKTYDLIEQEGHPQPAIYPLNLEGATVKDYGDLAENIRDSLGRLDGLVLHAGWAGTLTPMKGYDPELWFKVINSNLHGPFFLSQAVLPLLEDSPHGSLVVSTQDCRKAFWGAFGMAKAAQDAMIDILAREHRNEKHFIHVNGIDTGPVRSRFRAGHYPAENAEKLPRPEDVVGPYLYLLDTTDPEHTGLHLSLEGHVPEPAPRPHRQPQEG
ncbi:MULTISPECIES: SDR family NAD(P)-dependent oxidoreductase [unclassified Thioalkalivibrio]|uniref:SDR family NAD(P)-dependent oxidoreductase n=1 Tax=unclassified Thioalkalivibrio TaxID=2621013 RepID=UPI000376CE89|nr:MULTISPECIES: SDR family NAD(P)-dependent oxidoreductase [unclassified Thioalkalivibrio]